MDGVTPVFGGVFVLGGVLILGAIMAAALAVGCLVMVIIAIRRGRFRQALASAVGSVAAARAARGQDYVEDTTGRTPAFGVYGASAFGMKPGSISADEVNPATGLPMVSAGTDAGGNVFGEGDDSFASYKDD